jgi:hypothetical protein
MDFIFPRPSRYCTKNADGSWEETHDKLSFATYPSMFLASFLLVLFSPLLNLNRNMSHLTMVMVLVQRATSLTIEIAGIHSGRTRD